MELETMPVFNCAIGTVRMEPDERMTARSMRFSIYGCFPNARTRAPGAHEAAWAGDRAQFHQLHQGRRFRYLRLQIGRCAGRQRGERALLMPEQFTF